MMCMAGESAIVAMRELKRELKYAGTVVITMEAKFPQVEISENRAAQNRINSRIRFQVNRFLQYSGTVLYRQAIRQYRDSQKDHFPFHPYEALLHYEVTYNQDCYFSLFRDRYVFTGGAHGTTLRSSDTWSLQTGRILTLPQIFVSCSGYRERIIEQILRQADEKMRREPGVLFENYRELVVQNFNEESFYLTSKGMAFYYQQYDIAPYSSGILVFTIPYQVLGWAPSC